MTGLATRVRKKTGAKRPSSPLRRAADIALIVLALAAIGLFVATKIIGGRADVANGTNGPNGKNGNGSGAASSSIGPEGGPGSTGVFADLETGPDELAD